LIVDADTGGSIAPLLRRCRISLTQVGESADLVANESAVPRHAFAIEYAISISMGRQVSDAIDFVPNVSEHLALRRSFSARCGLEQEALMRP
jgi:hypothetical protein